MLLSIVIVIYLFSAFSPPNHVTVGAENNFSLLFLCVLIFSDDTLNQSV